MTTTKIVRPVLTLSYIANYIKNKAIPLSCGGHYDIFHTDDSPSIWDFLLCSRSSLIKHGDEAATANFDKFVKTIIDDIYVNQYCNITALRDSGLAESSDLDMTKGLRLEAMPSKAHIKWALKALGLQRDYISGAVKVYRPEKNFSIADLEAVAKNDIVYDVSTRLEEESLRKLYSEPQNKTKKDSKEELEIAESSNADEMIDDSDIDNFLEDIENLDNIDDNVDDLSIEHVN